MLIFICIYMYVCMFFSDRVIKNHSCGGMIAYAREWHEEVHGLWGIKWKNSHEKYMRSIWSGYNLILCACSMPMFLSWQIMLKDTLEKLRQCGFQHASTRKGKTLEARLLGRDSVVLVVWYYCCAYVVYVVHVASVMLFSCCLCNVMYMVLHIVLCEYCICRVWV